MSVMKERLTEAAELLGMDPADLLARLDPNGETWGWAGDPVAPGGTERPAPEGLSVFAHWSSAHDGINIEVDAPAGLPLTIHVNDDRLVDITIPLDITVGDVWRFRLNRLPDWTTELHDGQDVLVTGTTQDPLWFTAEALDGATLTVHATELIPGATTPPERFAGFDDTESDREPSPEQERAWDLREDEARGSAL